MATITPNKTDGIEIIAHALATHPTTIKSSEQNVATKVAVKLFMYHGPIEAAANTNPGKFQVQFNHNNAGAGLNEEWITQHEFVTNDGTPSDEDPDATEPIGETVIAVTLTAGFALEDLLYFFHSTLANSEWAELRKLTTDTSITIVDGLTNEQTAAATTLFNDASLFVATFDLRSVENYRVVWSHEGATGADCHIKVFAVTYDSDNSA